MNALLSLVALMNFMDLQIPDWMVEQIQNDLAPHRETGISIEDLEKTQASVPGLIRVTIKDNEVMWSASQDLSEHKRLQLPLDLIRAATEHAQLPDVTFLMSMLDCYDYPFALQDTQCPVFTICKLKGNNKAILWPEMKGFHGKVRWLAILKRNFEYYSWESKKEMAFWRGRSTGWHLSPRDWDYIPRMPLVLFSLRRPDLIDARFSAVFWANPDVRQIIKGEYSGSVLSPEKQLAYKYLIAVDGNTFPSSLIWQLGANSTVIKNRSDYIEWFHQGLVENTHYVSYETDCSDLESVIDFLKNNDEKARKIADNATAFANKYINYEHAALYVYLLLKEYAKLASN